MSNVKKGPTRTKNPGIERDEKRPESRWVMKARPEGWGDGDEFEIDDAPNKQMIPRHMIPEGMDMRWVTDSVFGQPFAEWRGQAERAGWTPVHPEDFDGQFDGMYAPKGAKGECRVEGQVLMARPMELSTKARRRDRRAALEQVSIKEQALTGGNIEKVSLDTQHESALRSNKISRSYERIAIPQD